MIIDESYHDHMDERREKLKAERALLTLKSERQMHLASEMLEDFQDMLFGQILPLAVEPMMTAELEGETYVIRMEGERRQQGDEFNSGAVVIGPDYHLRMHIRMNPPRDA